MNDDGCLADVCGGKTGSELFRELLRIYSEAHLEDYYKMGQWQNRVMRTDYVLINAHRKEAGAPPPPPLSEIPEPKLPQQKVLTLPGILGSMASKPTGGMPAAVAQLVASVSQQAGPSTELRNCAIFISRNKLDPRRSKVMLMALPLDQRQLIYDSFASDQIGMEATDDLEQFIKENAKPGATASPALAIGQRKAGPPGATASPALAIGQRRAAAALRPSAAGSFSAEELKPLALFIAKNRLDPTRAKAALMKLSMEERKVAIASFASAAKGLEATAELEAYVEECKDSVVEEPALKKTKAA